MSTCFSFFEVVVSILFIVPGYFLIENVFGEKYFKKIGRCKWDIFSRIIHYLIWSYLIFFILFFLNQYWWFINTIINFSNALGEVEKLYGKAMAQKLEIILFLLTLDSLVLAVLVVVWLVLRFLHYPNFLYNFIKCFKKSVKIKIIKCFKKSVKIKRKIEKK